MFVPASFAEAFPLLLVSLVCWGSWSNSVKLTRLPFSLYYIDFALSVLCTATLMALTLGGPDVPPNKGEGFTHTLSGGRLSGRNAGLAFAAGVVFNAANMLLVSAIEMVGLAIAFPVSIGLALVLGTVVTYAVQPKGDAVLLFVGVALALLAVVSDGLAHRELTRARRASAELKGTSGGKEPDASLPLIDPPKDVEGGPATAHGDHWRPTSVTARLLVCVVAGLLMGSWSPLTAASMSGSHALTPYGSFFFYTVGAVVSTVPFGAYFMKRPMVGNRCDWRGYKNAALRDHLPGWLGGAVWSLGTLFNLVGGRAVGFATSYAIGQSAPMVAALWGIWFGELKGAPKTAWLFFIAMFVFYIAAIATISLSN